MQLHPVREVSWTCKEAAFSAGLEADCSCTSYQGLCKGEKAQSSLHLDWGRIKPPQTLAIHLLSSATPSDWLFTQKLWAQSRSQIRHVQLLPQTSLLLRQSTAGLSQHRLWFPFNTYTATPQHLWDASRSEEDENTHINWMSSKIRYLNILKSPVANYCRRRTAHWCKRGILLGRPKSSSDKHWHEPVWFHLLYPHSNRESFMDEQP